MVEVNGHSMAVEDYGEGDAVLMIHGLGGSSNVWLPQAGILSRYYRTIVPDLAGSGRSPAVENLSIETLVADMIALLDAMGLKRAHVAAHSMGTLVAQHMAAQAPDRVASLFLLGPIKEPPAPARQGLRDRANAAREKGMAPIADALVQGSLSAETRAHRPAAVAFVREVVMRQDAEGYARTCEALAAGEAVDATRIRCPSLLVTGDEDGVGPPRVTVALAHELSQAPVKIATGSGHWMTVERPDFVTEALGNFYFTQE